MGNSEAMMARAARAVAEEGGGVAVATEEELTLLPLPVAGLMSPEPYEEVAQRSKAIGEALARAGCRLNYAFMTLSLLALVVLPELDRKSTRLNSSHANISYAVFCLKKKK